MIRSVQWAAVGALCVRGAGTTFTSDELTSLYCQYGPYIYARCARLLGDRSAAEDATQETFMRVHRHLHKASDHNHALAWIYRIATNYCLNMIRDRALHHQIEQCVPEAHGDNLQVSLTNRDTVARIVARCPAKLSVPAWLHHVDGLDHGEIARVLGISRRTVLNRLAAFADRSRKFLARSEP